MSNDKRLDKELEQALNELEQFRSQEQTDQALDDAVLQMAQQHLEQKDAASAAAGSWWHRLRVPVSVAAGLVVTLGVARLMVNLSGQDMSQLANEARQEQYANQLAVEWQAEQVQQDLSQRKAERVVAQEEQLLTAPQEVKEPPLAKVPPASEPQVEAIVISGSRVKATDTESSELAATEPIADSARSIEHPQSELDEAMLDEAVPGYPLPEVWLEQIEQALAAGDEILALEEWEQFERTYPEYEVEQKLLNQLKNLQKISENP